MITVDATAVTKGAVEKERLTASCTIGHFLRPYGYEDNDERSGHFVCVVNGEVIPAEDWPTYVIHPDDDVHFVLQANDPVTAMIVGAIVVGALLGVAVAMMYKPSVTGGQSQRGDTDRSSIQGANVEANTPRLGEPVPDIAGNPIVYPDVIVPARTYFVQEEKTDEAGNSTTLTVQWYEMGLNVGRGSFDKNVEDVYVGNTPFISLGDYAEFQYFEPGESVSGYSPFTWWHTSEEVGSTRTGDSGLELTKTLYVTARIDINSISVNGRTLTITSGESWPDDWEPGLLVQLTRQNYTIVFQNSDGRGRLVGNQLDYLNPAVGMTIEIINSENNGRYIVESYTPTDEESQAEVTLTYIGGATVTAWGWTGTDKVTIGIPGQVYTISSVNEDALVLTQPREIGYVAWQGFPPQTWNNISVPLDNSTRQADWIGPFSACPRNKTCTALEIDLHAPQGLIRYDNSDGSEQPVEVVVEIQMRERLTNNAWESSTHTFVESSRDARGFTVPFEFGSPRSPEVRVRLVSTKIEGSISSATQMNWYQMKAKMTGGVTRYPGFTTLGIRLQGDKRTSSFTDNKINCRVTRKLPRLLSNGQWSETLQGTANAVEFALYILKEAGYQDNYLNLQAWADLRVLVDNRGDTYRWSHTQEGTVKDLVTQILNTVFADITFHDGQLLPVRDEQRGDVPDAGISSQNMSEELTIQLTPPHYDDNDGVTVAYRDYFTWEEKTVDCAIDGDEFKRTKKITATGITDRDRAYRFGMRRRMEMALRRLTYTAVTGLDARNMRWMTFLGIANDVPGFTQSGKMSTYVPLSGGRVRVYTTQIFDWSADGRKLVCFRRPDGSLTTPSEATEVATSPEGSVLECAAPDFTPYMIGRQVEDPTDILFGPEQRFLYRTLVDEITISGGYGDEQEPKMTITAYNYTDDLYFYDNASAPENA